MSRGLNWLGFLALGALVLVAGGFLVYAGQVTGYRTPSTAQEADAIVVLTGDTGRLATGGRLLREGRAGTLLVSGVHPSVTRNDIRTHAGLSESEFSCCVRLGREAADTVGNAREAGALVSENAYESLIIVTSDYHLPRSLLEMKRTMPEVTLIPYPVRTQPPWRDAGVARLWLQEYAKYATVWLGGSGTSKTSGA
ncbi:YdcF family protein [Maricaulis sp. CAU 1757]